MTIYEQIIAVCAPFKGQLLTTGEIKRMVHEQYGTLEHSIIPSDYCYNRINKDTSRQKPIFEHVETGYYRYLGINYKFSGPHYQKPQHQEMEQIGEWQDGILTLFNTAKK